MSGTEVLQTPLGQNLLLFASLFTIFVLMIAYYQWQWHRKVDRFVKLIIVESDGSSTTHYVPKTSTHVDITNPDTQTTKTWPFSEICTIEMLYPGDGFIPTFLQRKIRTLIVDAKDWEPLLNRGQYSSGVASPDVKDALREIAESLQGEDTKKELLELADELKTAPTREMVASPAVLGNIAKEKVSELAVTVAKDIMNPLQEAIKKLSKQLNPTYVYIGLGLIIILLVYVVFQMSSMTNTDVSALADEVNKLKTAVGVQ